VVTDRNSAARRLMSCFDGNKRRKKICRRLDSGIDVRRAMAKFDFAADRRALGLYMSIDIGVCRYQGVNGVDRDDFGRVCCVSKSKGLQEKDSSWRDDLTM
jgi:hypothetical protein